MDLTSSFPRSPFEKLGGMVWLPRLIDKARAKLTGKLGDYRYNCPMDERLLSFLGLRADEFLAAVRAAGDDGAVLKKILRRARPAPGAIEEFNRSIGGAGPRAGETYFGIIDAEEGRGTGQG